MVFLLIRDAERRRLRRGRERQRGMVGVRFVQRFAALDIILQSLYHALCTFCTFQGRTNVDF